MSELDQLREQIVHLRGALAWIYNSTEPDAIKHRDYDHLASNISKLAKDALDGKFYDDMRAAETYDRLKDASGSAAPLDR
jgi:uncharacterized membrane protein